MNYYLDFDNTLYETSRLSNDMLKGLAYEISKKTSISENDIFDELKSMFNRENIYNIYKLAKFFAKKYNIEESILIDKVEDIILDGKKYVYDDVISFLKELKEKNHIINVLTYVAKEDLSYQLTKIKGSGLSEYFDNIIISSSLKFNFIEQGGRATQNVASLQINLHRNYSSTNYIRLTTKESNNNNWTPAGSGWGISNVSTSSFKCGSTYDWNVSGGYFFNWYTAGY